MITRDKQPMSKEVKQALIANNLMEDYLKRPRYQQNDYLSWINRAKQDTTKAKRLSQMIDELKIGGIYMKMNHQPSRKT